MEPTPATVFQILGAIPSCLQQMNPAEAAQLRTQWTSLVLNYTANVDQLNEEELIKRFESIADQLQQIVKTTPFFCNEFTGLATHARFKIEQYITDEGREDILRNTPKIANEIIRLKEEMEKDNLKKAKDQKK